MSNKRTLGNRKSQLAKLRDAKLSGKSLLSELNVEKEDLYSLVDESDYLRSKREYRDDFVVNDDGLGYVDIGQNEWDEPTAYSDEEESPNAQKRKLKRSEPAPITKIPKTNIQSLFNNPIKSRKAKPEKVEDTELDATLSQLLKELDGTPSSASSHPTPSKKIQTKPNIAKKPIPINPTIEKPLSNNSDDLLTSKLRREDEPKIIEDNDETEAMLDNFLNDDIDLDHFSNFGIEESTVQAPSAISDAKVDEKYAIIFNNDEWKDCVLWSDMIEKTATIKDPSVIPSNNEAMEEDLEDNGGESDKNMFYWIDAYEKNGVIFLFGKVKDKSRPGEWISACLQVNQLKRDLYVLPRVFLLDGSNQETSETVTFELMYQEIASICKKQNISKFQVKKEVKKYCFELPDIPREAEYLRLRYNYTEPPLPEGLTGKTFRHIFGINRNALEAFLIERGIMGPCWLEIGDWQESSLNISWCRAEYVVNNSSLIKPILNSDTPPPPLNVLCLNLRTALNAQKTANEIYMFNALVYKNVDINGPKPIESFPSDTYTAIRQKGDFPFPVGFVHKLTAANITIENCKTERGLLNYFSAIMQKIDADVIIGHNFIGYDLDVLLHRMRACKTDHWSRLGRLKRKTWPKLQAGAGGMSETHSAERSVVSGRLICDTYLSSKELIKSKTYSLTQLAASQLKIKREDLDAEKVMHSYEDAASLIRMIQHCMVDSRITASLATKLQVLPLTRQLTNIAGNLWARTLSGARAERNEYLLMHEFHRNNTICPDRTVIKYNNDKKQELEQDEDGVDDEPAALATKGGGGGRRKPTYAGGLVLEPKKGFYDNYVLVLDFNSLYPSIILEYNICFSTVNRSEDPEALPEIPDSSLNVGVLPKLIGGLVDRRRQVKQLMKDPKNSPNLNLQLDIRQKALKLTANSMYGCLGFVNSRFFAKPLAMLITAQGRKALQSTVQIAEAQGLEVIYGDTDSIMIYTGRESLEQVQELGHELKKQVNKLYKHLEIDMDGYFRRMLLLKKKKYAALIVQIGMDQSKTYAIESKGLDLVRRDWCELSHDTSNYVLEQILSGDGREEVVDRILKFLSVVGEQVKQGTIPLSKYVINKNLTKSPNDYADPKSLPHVQVAKKLISVGKSAKMGDAIPFVITLGEGETFAERAQHPDEVQKGNIAIDKEWYLKLQVLPPIARLCEPIDGIDIVQLAGALGLDSTQFAATLPSLAKIAKQENTLENRISLRTRFQSVERLCIKCPGCSAMEEFVGIFRYNPEKKDIESGLNCAICGVDLPVKTSLRSRAQYHIQTYQLGWLKCEENTCKFTTQQPSIKRCLKCGGRMLWSYSAAALDNQLKYYLALSNGESLAMHTNDFDLGSQQVQEWSRKLEKESKALKDTINLYIERNARNVVDLGDLFGFFNPALVHHHQQ